MNNTAPGQWLIKAPSNEGSLIDTAGLASPLTGINCDSHMMRMMTGSQCRQADDGTSAPDHLCSLFLNNMCCARVTSVRRFHPVALTGHLLFFFFFLSFLPFFFCPKTDSQLEGPIVGGSVRSVCVFVRWSRGPQANAGWLPQIELYCHWRLKEKWNSRFKNVPIENNKS